MDMSAAEIDSKAREALQRLYKSTPIAAEIAKKAKAVLIFPDVLKAGAGIGGFYGEGALLVNEDTVGYYSIAAASYGMQIGAQSYAYAMFFMNDDSLDYLDRNQGWEIGSGPSFVLVDKGMANTVTNTTLTKSVYVFTFSQKGLMAGSGIQGSKITKITPR